ncbi:Acid protease [Glarea lozoyensis ATCC 20868]|uniref:Acid protease n=1 Tax=Glarea lozoyensis (strain ATCC 20868 / MF5171) TaxID=1116229 RepID=S3CEA9_GLAL2|nr:Acid protease [Glarea lozoyensis ATCC 20868]EPE24792.1 Acid protease [Glarea lozoyensis ATCC 20868]
MELQRRSNVKPFNFSPSKFWEGNDGLWSTFLLRVGTPAQTFRVLISTMNQEIWVPLVGSCELSEPKNCADLRGIQPFQNAASPGFQTNKSSTWNFINLYGLAFEEVWQGYSENGMYGFDTVGLQIQNSGGVTRDHQIVAGIVTKDFLHGIFSLGPKPTNFSDFNDSQPSYLWSLKNQSLIPSLSYAYSAGAFYANRSLGTLTLGGYDASQMKEKELDWMFHVDSSSNLEVGLQVIVASDTFEGKQTSLLLNGITAYIDSTYPKIWLPLDACEAFEKAFGLNYDPTSFRYLINTTTHARLQSLNPTITFKIGNSTFGGLTRNIVFPYAAFDLQASYPIFENDTRYFPIRRADNSSHYTIGRVFLQEAYLVVVYGRRRFAMHQRSFGGNDEQNLVQISDPDSRLSSSRLGSGPIAGVVVGVILTFALLGWLYLRHRKWRQLKKILGRKPGAIEIVDDADAVEHNQTSTMELPNNAYFEAGGRVTAHEVDVRQSILVESGGREIEAELAVIGYR